MNNSNTPNIGLHIKQFRKKTNLNQQNFGKFIGVSNKTISAWENGTRKVSSRHMKIILKKFNLDINEFFRSVDAFSDNRFYICKSCGNVIFAKKDVKVSCCGLEIVSTHHDDFSENNPLEISVVDEFINIKIIHEMDNTHYIKFISYISEDGVSIKMLKPYDNPFTRFLYNGSGIIYSYCSMHGFSVQNFK